MGGYRVGRAVRVLALSLGALLAVAVGPARAEAQEYDVPSLSVDGVRCAVDVSLPVAAVGARVRAVAVVVASAAAGSAGIVPMTCEDGRVVREIAGPALAAFGSGAAAIDGALALRIGAPDVRCGAT